MNTKKIKKYFKKGGIAVFTFGAATILGGLALGGMLAVWPLLWLGLLAGLLAVAYEAEIFKKSFEGAVEKLSSGNKALELKLTREFLLKTLTQNNLDEDNNLKPQFIKDYEALLREHHQAEIDHQHKRQKKLNKLLKKMEKQIANQLFHPSVKTRKYEKDLAEWLENLNKNEFINGLRRLKGWHIGAKILGVVAGLFMIVAASYLLLDAFLVIPILMGISTGFLPFIIIPLAIIAGAAFGMQVYNAFTDMINNQTIQNWLKKIKAIFTGQQKVTDKDVVWAILSIVFILGAIALAFFTAGTFWTLVKKTAPLFAWMSKIPSLVFGILIPLVTGVAGLLFNIRNTLETFEAFRRIKLKNPITSIKEAWQAFKDNNTIGQILNPFRIFTFLLNVPTRIVLFLGHLASIGVASDQAPGLPPIAQAGTGLVLEFGEDFDFFFKIPDEPKIQQFNLQTSLKARIESGHGHSHESDIPTRVIRLIFTFIVPLYTFAALWDVGFRKNKNTPFFKEFKNALQKMYGEETAHHHHKKEIVLEDELLLQESHHDNHLQHDHDCDDHDLQHEEIQMENHAPQYLELQKTCAIRSIEKYQQKRFGGTRFFDQDNVEKKKIQLNNLKEAIENVESFGNLKEAIEHTKNNENITHHRLYKSKKPTQTQGFLENLTPKLEVSAY